MVANTTGIALFLSTIAQKKAIISFNLDLRFNAKLIFTTF